MVQGEGKNIDILGLSETYIVNGDASDNHNLYDLSGYIFINHNQTSGCGGGVGMYVKKSDKFKHIIDLEDSQLESTWIEIFIKHSKSLSVGCYYRPPETLKYLLTNYNNALNDNLTSINETKKEVYIMGDFNVNYNIACCCSCKRYVKTYSKCLAVKPVII